MAKSISVTAMRRNARGGIYAQFSDNTEREYASRREARQELDGILNETAVIELLKALAIARGLRASADGDDADDLDAIVGRTFTFNRAATNIVRVT